MSTHTIPLMCAGSDPLLLDLYQLTMLQGYYEHDMEETAVFELFVRRMPRGRGFLLAAGLEQALEYLEGLRFGAEDIEWLRARRGFSPSFLERLAQLRFTGDVHAVPEGTVVYTDEPLIRVTAPLPEAQIVETRLINLIHFQTLVASKAARCVLAAPGRTLIDFGLRRAHGAEAGLLAARASYLAGFTGTSTVLAERHFGIPAYGTMAHSFVEAHDDESEAFERFALSLREGIVLLIDTYDTEAAARKAVTLARRLQEHGVRIAAVRLDSGDLVEHSRQVRRILDEGGLRDTRIFCSGGLDEDALRAMCRARAPIDGFGIGTRLDTSADAPYLDCAYKLQEYAGRPRRKHSEGKATWPGRKQVYRLHDRDGRMRGDTVTIEGDVQPGEPLIRPVMRNGVRLEPAEGLGVLRERAAASLARLPAGLAALAPDAAAYPVEISDALSALAVECDRGIT